MHVIVGGATHVHSSTRLCGMKKYRSANQMMAENARREAMVLRCTIFAEQNTNIMLCVLVTTVPIVYTLCMI